MKCVTAISQHFFKYACRFSRRILPNLCADCPPRPCFLGRSTLNLPMMFFWSPCIVANKQPFPSITINPYNGASCSMSSRRFVWNRLSHMYNPRVRGFCGSITSLHIFSFPSGSITIPQNKASPFSGVSLYIFSLCWADLMAVITDCLFTRDLMLVAVPSSVVSIFCVKLIWLPDAIHNDTRLVPFPSTLVSLETCFFITRRAIWASYSVFVALITPTINTDTEPPLGCVLGIFCRTTSIFFELCLICVHWIIFLSTHSQKKLKRFLCKSLICADPLSQIHVNESCSDTKNECWKISERKKRKITIKIAWWIK